MSPSDKDRYEGLRLLAKYSGLGIQLIGTLGICIGIGYYVDQRIDPASQACTLIGALIGSVLAIYSLFRLSKEVRK